MQPRASRGRAVFFGGFSVAASISSQDQSASPSSSVASSVPINNPRGMRWNHADAASHCGQTSTGERAIVVNLLTRWPHDHAVIFSLSASSSTCFADCSICQRPKDGQAACARSRIGLSASAGGIRLSVQSRVLWVVFEHQSAGLPIGASCAGSQNAVASERTL